MDTSLIAASTNSCPAETDRLLQDSRGSLDVQHHFACLKFKLPLLLVAVNLVVYLLPGTVHSLLPVLAINDYGEHFPPSHSSHVAETHPTLYAGAHIFVCLMFPIAGALGDIRFGRYRAVVGSMLLMTVGLLAFSALGICLPERYLHLNIENISTPVYFVAVAYLVVYVGFAGYQANVLQFAVNQLQDATSDEVGTMIRWYFWVTIFAQKASELFLYALYTCNVDHLGIFMGGCGLGVSVCMVVTLLVMFVLKCKRRIRVEPESHNPYRMVCSVLNFARKHKHPLRPGSLLYWDDKAASRLDFAKQMYGGPFSSEEVEDVKTFFRLLLVIVAMGAYFFINVSSESSLYLYTKHLNYLAVMPNNHSCSIRNEVISSYLVVAAFTTVLVLAYELIIHPRLRSRFPNLLTSVGIGLLLIAISVMYTFVVEAVATGVYRNEGENFNCMFTLRKSTFHNYMNVSIRVMIPPMLLNVCGFMLVCNSGLQIIVAQAPHSMKGMLIGLFYFVNGPYTLLAMLLMLPFSFPFKDHRVTYPSCGFGYYLSNTVIAVVALMLYSVVAKRYRYRQRR